MSAATFTTDVNTNTQPELKPPIPPVRTRSPTLTTERAIEKYIEMRDKIAALKKQHIQELAPFNLAKDTLEAWLLEDLSNANVEAMRATTGTVYKSVRTSATVSEWSKTLEFIRTRDAWELLEARVSKLAAEAILNETQAPIPGVNITREVILNVRKPTGSAG